MIPLHKLLDALGADPDTVAATLCEQGFRGSIGDGESCPVANYLRVNGVADAAVEVSSVSYTRAGRIITEQLPVPVQDFVMLFDDGAYPHLEQAEGA